MSLYVFPNLFFCPLKEFPVSLAIDSQLFQQTLKANTQGTRLLFIQTLHNRQWSDKVKVLNLLHATQKQNKYEVIFIRIDINTRCIFWNCVGLNVNSSSKIAMMTGSASSYQTWDISENTFHRLWPMWVRLMTRSTHWVQQLDPGRCGIDRSLWTQQSLICCVCLFPFFCDQILATLTLILSVWLKGWWCRWVCWSPGVYLNHYQVKTFSVCLLVSKSVPVMTLRSATAVLCARCSVVEDIDFSIPAPAADSRSYFSLFLNLSSVHIAPPNLNHSQSLRVLVTHLIRSS